MACAEFMVAEGATGGAVLDEGVLAIVVRRSTPASPDGLRGSPNVAQPLGCWFTKRAGHASMGHDGRLLAHHQLDAGACRGEHQRVTSNRARRTECQGAN
jgi:hypothetical protein